MFSPTTPRGPIVGAPACAETRTGGARKGLSSHGEEVAKACLEPGSAQTLHHELPELQKAPEGRSRCTCGDPQRKGGSRRWLLEAAAIALTTNLY